MTAGLVCFDLDCYLQMAEKSGKWQCPSTRTFYTWRDLQVGCVCYESPILQWSSLHAFESLTTVDAPFAVLC